jgi:putative transposase
VAITSFKPRLPVLLDGRKHTILRKVGSDIWQLEENSTARIVEFSFQDLLTKYADRTLSFSHENTANPQERTTPTGAFLEKIPSDQINDAKTKRSYVIAIEGLPTTKVQILPVIEETWKKLGAPAKKPSFASVCRWRKRFLEQNRSITALLSRRYRSGNRVRRYSVYVISIVQECIDFVYLSELRKSITDTFDAACLRVKRENDLRPLADQLELPTISLVRSEIFAIPAYDRYAARHGKLAAEKAFRSAKGHVIIEMPLDQAQIDHTRLDVFVIDDVRWLPLGRPWITVMVDTCTRCILGIFISFAAPSYLSVGKCLKHAFTPKTSLREDYPSIRNEWLPYGVPRAIVVDNGTEFHSESLEKILLILGCEIHYSPRKRPWFKGHIERVIGTLNKGVAHGQPGTTYSNIFEKEDYDPKKNAVIRLSTLIEATHTWVVDFYHQKVHRSLQIPPIVAWTSGITHEDILIPEDPLLIDAIVAKSDTRLLSHKGIEYDNLFYNSPALTQLRRRMNCDSFKVDIRYNPELIDSIIVIAPDTQELYEVPALAIDYARGLNQWQHRILVRYAASELKQYDTRGWLEAKARISELYQMDAGLKKVHTRKEKTEKGMAIKHSNTSITQSSSANILTQQLATTDERTNTIRTTTTSELAIAFEPIMENRSKHMQYDNIEEIK